MGCSNEKPAQGTLLEHYSQANLPQPWAGDYENDFEKQIYMAINLCRHDPKRFIPFVRQQYKTHPLLAGGIGKRQNDLIKALTAQAQEGSLAAIKFDATCTQACRDNNKVATEANSETPALGGNAAKYGEILGEDKTAACSEFTMVKFQGSTGDQFVALQLALDFEGLNEGTKDKMAPADPSAAPVSDLAGTDSANAMDADAVAVPNGMDTDAVAAQPNGMDTDAVAQPAEENKEAAATAAPKDTKKADAKKKPAEKVAAPAGYLPILDKELTMMGVSNKAHQKTINIIQVLYVKSAVNAMV